MNKPDPTEYAPYFEKYVSLVPTGDISEILNAQIEGTVNLLGAASQAQADFRYAPGKWSLKESVGHVIDTERIFAYRALRIARGDQTPLPSFDENLYVANSGFDARGLADLVDELIQTRRSNVHLLKHLTDEAWIRRGTASDREISVRALAYIIAGHELHHQKIWSESYLGNAAQQS